MIFALLLLACHAPAAPDRYAGVPAEVRAPSRGGLSERRVAAIFFAERAAALGDLPAEEAARRNTRFETSNWEEVWLRYPPQGAALDVAKQGMEDAHTSCEIGIYWERHRGDPFEGEARALGLELARLAGDAALARRLLLPHEGPQWLAEAAYQRGHFQEAAEILARGGVRPEERELFGRVAWALGNESRAWEVWQAPSPAGVDAALSRGDLARARDLAGSRAVLLAKVLLATGEVEEVMTPEVQARAAWELGRPELALDALAVLSEETPALWRDRAKVLSALGRAEEALAAWRRAAALEPGVASLKIAEITLIPDDIERSVVENPCVPEALALAARYSDPERALTAWERVLAVAPLHPEALVEVALRTPDSARAAQLQARARRSAAW